MTGTVRADQVGSFLRPERLKEARAAFSAGRLTADQLREVEDSCIDDVIDGQRRAGIEVMTDGELRRVSFMGDVTAAVEGFARGENIAFTWRDDGGEVERDSILMIVDGPLRQKRRLAQAEAHYLLSKGVRSVKVTLPSPMLFASTGFRPGVTDQFYADRPALALAFAEIIGHEASQLVAEGVSYIQIDAPGYTHYIDPRLSFQMQSRGMNLDQAIDAAIGADNACLTGLDRTRVTTGIHLCRGNSEGRWVAEGGYDALADRLFNQLAYDRFLLEFDTDRSGGFEPLRFLPKGKTVVLGLISTKTGTLEAQDQVMRRLDDASRFVSLDQVALSPQCGFASNWAGNPLTEEEQWRKLELVVAVAGRVWPRS